MPTSNVITAPEDTTTKVPVLATVEVLEVLANDVLDSTDGGGVAVAVGMGNGVGEVCEAGVGVCVAGLGVDVGDIGVVGVAGVRLGVGEGDGEADGEEDGVGEGTGVPRISVKVVSL